MSKYIYYIHPKNAIQEGALFASRNPVTHLMKMSIYVNYLERLRTAYGNQGVCPRLSERCGEVELPMKLRLDIMESMSKTLCIVPLAKCDLRHMRSVKDVMANTLHSVGCNVHNNSSSRITNQQHDITLDQLMGKSCDIDVFITDYAETLEYPTLF